MTRKHMKYITDISDKERKTEMRTAGQLKVGKQMREVNVTCECLRGNNIKNTTHNCEKCNNNTCVVKRQIKDKVGSRSNPIACVNCVTCKKEKCSLFKYRAENRAKELCDYFEQQEQGIDENSKDFGKMSLYNA